MQNFIYSINSNSRGGAEPAFSNLTFDLTPPEDMIDNPVIAGGTFLDYTYRECQKEMDLINKAFYNIMYNGDAAGKLFSYPIPTYNIHKRFDWDNPNNEMLWEMAGKYGTPYFANFLNSDLNISDIRSMCCRLRIDLKELKKRNGGLFGSGDSTGSIGVVTVNLPRIGYKSNTEEEFFTELDRLLAICKDSLVIKRKWIQENIIDNKLIPAFIEYVGTIKNHFNTIGVIGMNEMCLNFLGESISTDKGRNFSLKVGEYIREKLLQFQKETGEMFNYEATPAEGCCYSLALKDKKMFPDIITQGKGKDIYYTNSCHLPVSTTITLDEVFRHQEPLQQQFTGGTVIHIYLEGSISGHQSKHIVKSICENYKVPYISLSPISRYCPEHGYEKNVTDVCSKCGKKVQMYQRITGYLRCVDNFNIGKKQEFKERRQFSSESKTDNTGEI